MKWEFDNDRPIYVQLVENLKLAIITDVYKKGERMPSVRDLAMETKVNPNTMQKALSELETSGLVVAQRTSGRFVTESDTLIEECKNAFATQQTKKYLMSMRKLGLSKEEMISYLKREEIQK